MTQDNVNKEEWGKAGNWSAGSKWICVYFSHKDSRTWVPKRIPSHGCTMNLAKQAGVAWLTGFLVGIPDFIILVFMVIIPSSCDAKDSVPPGIVSTFPQNGSQNVDPSIKEISVTFNEEMLDRSWSWAYTYKNEFPEMTGQPYYADNMKKNVLPVKLEPNKEYVIWINSMKFTGFKDRAGNSLEPFKFTFKTK